MFHELNINEIYFNYEQKIDIYTKLLLMKFAFSRNIFN